MRPSPASLMLGGLVLLVACGDGFSIDDAALCAVPDVLKVDGTANAARAAREIDLDNLQSQSLVDDGRRLDAAAEAYLASRSASTELQLVDVVGVVEQECDER